MPRTEKNPQVNDLRLSKKLSSFDLFAIGFGAIIGVGWVISVGDWIDLGGGPLPVLLAFFIGAALLLPVGWVYGRLSSRYAKAGGALIFSRMAFGKPMGFLTGWFLALGYIMLCPWEVIAIGQVVENLLPELRTIPLYSIDGYTIYLPILAVTLAISAIVIICNFVSVEKVAKMQRILVVGLMVLGALSIIVALTKGTPTKQIFENSSTPKNPSGGFVRGLTAVLTITPFYFAGFDTIPQEAEEYDAGSNKKGICRMVVLSIIIACAFYILITMSVSIAMPWRQVIEYEFPASAAYKYGLGLPIIAKIIVIGALCGLISTLNSFFMAGARVLLALGREGMITEKMSVIHPSYKTPYYANILIAIITLVGSFLGKRLLLPIINVCSLSFVVAWLLVSLSSLKIMKDRQEKESRLNKGLNIIAIGSGIAILSLLVFPWSSGALKWPLEWVIVISWLIIGAILYYLNAKRNVTSC